MEITMIYVPFPDKESAENIMKILISKKLIACGNLFSAYSCYEWQGTLTSDDEWIAIMKTTIEKTYDAVQAISSLHKYEVPAILSWNVRANETYARWVTEQVTQKP